MTASLDIDYVFFPHFSQVLLVPLNELEELAAAIETKNKQKRKETRNSREGPMNYVSPSDSVFIFSFVCFSFLFRMSFPPLCVSQKSSFLFLFFVQKADAF